MVFKRGDYAGRTITAPGHIQNFTTSRTPSGQPVENWEDGKTIWAEVKGISGRELLAAGVEHADATIRVWVRFRRDISATSRLKVLTGPFKGAVLNVTGPPVPDIRGTRLEILCKQGTEKMIDVNLDFSGLHDIARDLQTLSKAENNKVLRDSTRAGAEVLRQEVIDRAPEKTGKLKKTLLSSPRKAAVAVKSPRGCIFVVLIRERETATTP
ncbi:head-tail adaptor protein [Klebsiella michiganensis]|nr:head-tail adaptor protein [Klebsiella michiganensis]